MKKESAICKKLSLTGNFPLTALTIKQVTEITLLSHIESKQLMKMYSVYKDSMFSSCSLYT